MRISLAYFWGPYTRFINGDYQLAGIHLGRPEPGEWLTVGLLSPGFRVQGLRGSGFRV